MKAYCVFSLLMIVTAAAAYPQQESSRSTERRFDLNGNPIPGASVSETKLKTAYGEKTVRTEYETDANGRKVPVMSVEEVKQDAGGGRTTTTRILHRYDQNGNPTSAERVVSDESTSGKSSTTKTSVYRKDINGNETLDEQAVSQSDGKNSTTDVLRRASDGSLVLAERQTTITEELPQGGSKSQAVIYRKDNNGNLYAAVQDVKETVKKGNETVETVAQFVRGGQGNMELAQEKVIRAVAQPDGTVSKQVDVYGAAVPGLTNTSGAPVLKERQSVEVRKGSNGTLVETTVSRKATVDGGELSAPRVISETVTKVDKQP